jgi:hypothetical protein
MMLEHLVSFAERTTVLTVIVGFVITVLRVRQPRLQLIAWTVVLGASPEESTVARCSDA